jgi:lysophospholipase L1-like esterase
MCHPWRRIGESARFLALGDSYTVGEGVPRSASWPAQLARQLRTAGIAIDEPVVVARTGWTCEELLAAVRTALRAGRLAPPWDLVTLLAGVNDQYRGRPAARWHADFVVLLEEALRLAADRAERLVVLSVPDWGASPFAQGRDRAAITAEIATLNHEQRRLALATGATWLDVAAAACVEPAGGEAGGYSALDGLHPSAHTYTAWVERMLPVVRPILEGGHRTPAPPTSAR